MQEERTRSDFSGRRPSQVVSKVGGVSISGEQRTTQPEGRMQRNGKLQDASCKSFYCCSPGTPVIRTFGSCTSGRAPVCEVCQVGVFVGTVQRAILVILQRPKSEVEGASPPVVRESATEKMCPSTVRRPAAVLPASSTSLIDRTNPRLALCKPWLRK